MNLRIFRTGASTLFCHAVLFFGTGLAQAGPLWGVTNYAGESILYPIDSNSGSIGPTRLLTSGGALPGFTDGLAFSSSGVLWGATNYVDESLIYQIDQATGAIGPSKLLSSGGAIPGTIDGIAFDGTGTMWGATNFAGQSIVYQIDSTSGAIGPTKLLTSGGAIPGTIGDIAFAPDSIVSSVPEPETWILLAAGLGLVAPASRMRRSTPATRA